MLLIIIIKTKNKNRDISWFRERKMISTQKGEEDTM